MLFFFAEPMVGYDTDVLLLTSNEWGISQLLAQKVRSVTTVVNFGFEQTLSLNSYYPTEISSKIHYLSRFSDYKSIIFNKSSPYGMIFKFDPHGVYKAVKLPKLKASKQICYETKYEIYTKDNRRHHMPYLHFQDGSIRKDTLNPKDFGDLNLLKHLMI